MLHAEDGDAADEGAAGGDEDAAPGSAAQPRHVRSPEARGPGGGIAAAGSLGRRDNYAVRSPPPPVNAACAAASRAIGTRNGEQVT